MLAMAGCHARDSRAAFIDSRPSPGLAERFYPPENWAWGQISVQGGPVQRYGVAAPQTVAKAQVLILPDYGESAETWFETVRDLTGAGYAVWVLEGVGQGGSARLANRRDLGETRSFAADVTGARGMIQSIVRPSPDRPLLVLGQGVGAMVAARAVERGARPAGLILSAAPCEDVAAEGLLRQIGLGVLRAPGGGAWTRGGLDDFRSGRTHEPWRGAITHAWQTVNPDLRMGGPSLDWKAAFAELQRRTLDDLDRLNAPTLILDADRSSACLTVPGADRRASRARAGRWNWKPIGRGPHGWRPSNGSRSSGPRTPPSGPIRRPSQKPSFQRPGLTLGPCRMEPEKTDVSQAISILGLHYAPDGYLHGLRQTFLEARLKFRLPAEPDWSLVDTGAAPRPAPRRRRRRPHSPPRARRPPCKRIFHWTAEFQLVAGRRRIRAWQGALARRRRDRPDRARPALP